MNLTPAKLTNSNRPLLVSDRPLIQEDKPIAYSYLHRLTTYAFNALKNPEIIGGVIGISAYLLNRTYVCIKNGSGCYITYGITGMVTVVGLTTLGMIIKSKKKIDKSPNKYLLGSSLENRDHYRYIQREKIKDKELIQKLLEYTLGNLKVGFVLGRWLQVKGYKSIEIALEETRKSIEKEIGLCWGYSNAIINQIVKHGDPNISCLKLSELITYENIFLIQQFLVIFMELTSGITDDPELKYELLSSGLIKKVCKSHFSTTDFNTLSFLLNNSILDPQFSRTLFYCSPAYNIPKDLKELKNLMYYVLEHAEEERLSGKINTFTVDDGEKKFCVGTINLYNNKSGHTFFFQIGNLYRFHDSYISWAGFYEFPSEDIFYESLNTHLDLCRKRFQTIYVTLYYVPIINEVKE